jgi:hypothetical protein
MFVIVALLSGPILSRLLLAQHLLQETSVSDFCRTDLAQKTFLAPKQVEQYPSLEVILRFRELIAKASNILLAKPNDIHFIATP